MRLLVIGSGMMGRAIVWDILKSDQLERVTVIDRDEKALRTLRLAGKRKKVRTVSMDIGQAKPLAKLMQEADTVISAVTYKFNYELARLAVRNGCNFCDLGGNNAIVKKEFTLHREAQRQGVTVIPDCGLAPGLVSVLTAHGFGLCETVERVRLRVGGLPVNPKPPLNYQLVFSVHGLINEYAEPCVNIVDGKITRVPPMEDVEELEFPEPFGKLEAFNTSGGTSTLPYTYRGKIKNLDYKTIRYPGHAAQIRFLMNLGLMGTKPVMLGKNAVVPRDLLAHQLLKVMPDKGPDCILLRVTVDGIKDGKNRRITYQLIDYGEPEIGITAMMRMTGYPASVIAQMMSRGLISKKGAVPQELAVPADAFVDALKKRGIPLEIHISDSN